MRLLLQLIGGPRDGAEEVRYRVGPYPIVNHRQGGEYASRKPWDGKSETIRLLWNPDPCLIAPQNQGLRRFIDAVAEAQAKLGVWRALTPLELNRIFYTARNSNASR